jgi:hypothetical protein
VHSPLSLSLCALRNHDKQSFPLKYRYAITHGEEVFRSGEPAKGVSLIYDEVEDIIRKLAARVDKIGLWRTLKPGEKRPKYRLKKDSREKITKLLIDHVDFQRCKVPQPLLGRVWGITPHRNDSAHKPTSMKTLIQRNTELRTRFETAADILRDLCVATSSLRL